MPEPTITPQTKIQVGLAVGLVAAAGTLYLQVYNLGGSLRLELSELSNRVEGRYISKELFQAELNSLRRETDQNVRMLDAKLSELKSAVSTLQAGSGR